MTESTLEHFMGRSIDILSEPVPSSVSIIRNDKIGIGVLYLPKNSFIDLHDHPSMVVTSKIIKGKITRYALDLLHKSIGNGLGGNTLNIEESPPNLQNMEFHALVRPKVVLEEGEIFNLTPMSGNVHCFYVSEPTILMDVLTPYYNTERTCNFYEIVECNINKKISCEYCKALIPSFIRQGDQVEISKIRRINEPDYFKFKELSFGKKVDNTKTYDESSCN